ncbi:MAG: 16S rRNA (cytosine(967)-C(5))-methyltransferase RsmB [Spongiibacteraceae bacterium]
MSKKALDCRAAAAHCIAAVANGASLSQQIPLFEQQVDERDRALFRQLCYGVLRFYPKLLGVTRQLLSKPMKDKDRDVLMLLLLGIYQLTETRIPDHAAVSATVAATRALKKPWAKALVNGVLRQWQRRQDDLLAQLSPAEALAHPEWLHQALNSAWPEQAEAIELANNQHPPMCLRVNQQQVTTEDYLQQLIAADISAKRCEYSPHGIRLDQASAVEKLPGFNEGFASVQDEAPQLSAQLLALAPGQRVLDACCAPGGKTCHILESEPELTQLIALDIDQDRLNRVEQNLQRLQLQAQVIAGDAANPESWWDGKMFDRILLDAPCSATGVIRRNPDIKLHRNAADIQNLSALQLDILTALWATLKPGGLLLYATCSVLPDENENVVARFCQQQIDAEHQTITANWGLARDYGRQLFPQPHGPDGFFYALLAKKL